MSKCNSITNFARGGAPLAISAHSRHLEPIGEGPYRGNSRRWGDAPAQTRNEVVREIISQSSASGLSPWETAFAIAVAKVESGFNPDAAAGSSSASGVGQLINSTATHYGLTDKTRFSLRENVRAMVTLLKELLTKAKQGEQRLSEIFTKAYALYHDGPSLNHGGEKIAREKVIPETVNAWRWLNCITTVDGGFRAVDGQN